MRASSAAAGQGEPTAPRRRNTSAAAPQRRSPRHSVAVAALVAVAVAWGGAFGVVKETLTSVDPATLVTWRFTVAALVLAIVQPRCLRGLTLAALLRGLVLGGLLAAGFLLHTWGMRSTSVVVSAFVTGTVVVFAPLVAKIWLRRRLTRRTVMATGLATVGLAVITGRGTSFGAGALLIALAAILWAIHLVALEVWSRPGEVYQTALIQMAVVAVLAALVETVSAGQVATPTTISAGVALLWLGTVATGGAFLLLTWAQTRTDATTSAVVLTLEPVFGAVTAFALGETLSVPVALGAAAVIAAAYVMAWPQRRVLDPPT